ncbi:hypothetical protein [Streptomyces sp. NPDC088801]|uniref:hypothetical protein n=1 Tax=Streptomyces sp. NPDC088801 TaxID=3365903 RepID=UPI00380B6EA3
MKGSPADEFPTSSLAQRPGCVIGAGFVPIRLAAQERVVWYFAAVFPPRVRQALAAGASQL